MATKPQTISDTSDAHRVAAVQDSLETSAQLLSINREHHRLSVQPLRARLGEFEVDLRTGELHAGARTVRLQEQPFQVLRMLLQRDGEMVTREEIQATLWADGTIVDFDHSINAAIKKLRRALEDSADHPRYIDTIARRGYRLMVSVQWTQNRGSGQSQAEEVQNGTPQHSIGHLADGGVTKHRRLRVLDGEPRLDAATQSLRASRQPIHQPQGKGGPSVVVKVQHRKLEDLLCLEKLVLSRIRRLRQRQRCLYRLQTPARG